MGNIGNGYGILCDFMKNTTTRLTIIIFGLLCTVFLCCLKLTYNIIPGFTVNYGVGGYEEFDTYYDSHNGEVYLFLPSYVNENEFSLEKGDSVVIDNNKVNNNEIADYLDGGEHTLRMNGREYPFVVLRGSDSVATMYIDTESGSLKRIYKDKEIKENISLRINDSTGEECYYSDFGHDTMSGHGNTTWELYAKKPFTITLEEPASILSMNKSDKLVLIANSIDLTNLRNKFAYEMVRRSCSSVWAPDSRYVDVYINGQYQGLYLLCQKPTAYNSGLSEREYYVELLAQNIKEIKSDHNGTDDAEYVTDRMREVNNIIVSNSIEKTFEVIDKDSWAEKYLIDEVLLNHDGAIASQFYHFGDNSKVYAGPSWDYDKIFGAYYWVSNPNTLFAIRRGFMNDNWYSFLYRNEEFFSEVCNKYQCRIRPNMLKIYFDIDSMYEEIYDSAYMNSKRWDVNLFEEDLMYLKNFIRERIDFLDRAWINKENTYYVEVQTGINYKSYTVFDIMTVEELFTKEQIDVPIDNLIYRDTGQSVHKNDVISSEYTVIDDVRYIGD